MVAIGLLRDIQTIEIALPAAVCFVLATRLYYGPVIFAPRFMSLWAVGRRVLTPILQRVIYRSIPINISLESTVGTEEYVGVVEQSPTQLALQIDGERNVEIPLLATYATDWDGNAEAGTFVWYCGSKPSWLPRWLKPHQVHVTCFRIGSKTRLTAHFEANSYRPDMWLAHVSTGEHRSPAKGVQRTKRALSDAGVSLSNTELELEV